MRNTNLFLEKVHRTAKKKKKKRRKLCPGFRNEFSFFPKRILFFQKEISFSKFSFSKNNSLFPKNNSLFPKRILFYSKRILLLFKKKSLFVRKDRHNEELNPADVYFGLFYVFSSKKGRFLRQFCAFQAFIKPPLLRFLQTMMIIFAGEITTTKSVCVGTIHEYINSRTSSP
jgi:hypothetical protein